MDAYRKGATGQLADNATRKYHGHCQLPSEWLSKIKKEDPTNFEEKFGGEQHSSSNNNKTSSSSSSCNSITFTTTTTITAVSAASVPQPYRRQALVLVGINRRQIVRRPARGMTESS
jgi:hypothetical protein